MGSTAVPHAWKNEESEIYQVELIGKGPGMLIGRGETLDAIQHLTNYAVNRTGGGGCASAWTQ